MTDSRTRGKPALLRFLLYLLVAAGIYVLATVLALWLMLTLTTEVAGGATSYQQLGSNLCGAAAVWGYLRRISPQVGYRELDALAVFIPVVNILFIVKVLWRYSRRSA